MPRKTPRLRTELVRVQFWECLDASHRHQTKEVAAICVAKALRPKIAPYRKWTPAERADVLRRFRAGEKKVDIARGYRLSGNRVSQVIARAEREEWYAAERRKQAPLSDRIAEIVVRESGPDEPV